MWDKNTKEKLQDKRILRDLNFRRLILWIRNTILMFDYEILDCETEMILAGYISDILKRVYKKNKCIVETQLNYETRNVDVIIKTPDGEVEYTRVIDYDDNSLIAQSHLVENIKSEL